MIHLRKIRCPSKLRQRGRGGLTLLEVILALTILGIACAFMAQAMQLATSNAIAAQRQAEAELAADSVMSQVIAGVIPMQPTTTWTPIGTSTTSSSWSYMLQLVPCEVANMLSIQIDVRDDSDQDLTRPADLTVIRWIIDPALGLDLPPDALGTGEETGQGAAATGAAGSTGGQMGMPGGALNGRF
jgi:prepilin-type N-terminal cleavage/methylation domain-containing protein